MISEAELKEFNGFLQESPLRNKFLPVMLHICKLKPKGFDVDEYVDKDGRPVVKFVIETDWGWGWDDKDKKKYSYYINRLYKLNGQEGEGI
jgi:hypothetical protein